MTTMLDLPPGPSIPNLPEPTPTTLGGRFRHRLRRPVWNRFTVLQLVVMALATIAPVTIAVVLTGGALGLIPTETMIEIALGAGEEPGMFTFAAMFLASPVQWITGRTQIRVRKYLGIVFFLLALSNGAMFVLESGLAAALGAPFLIAGVIALALSLPLFLTSSRWSQRAMGLKRWQLLHRATYVIAIALVAHVLLIPEDIGISVLLIVAGFILRLPPVRLWLVRRRR